MINQNRHFVHVTSGFNGFSNRHLDLKVSDDVERWFTIPNIVKRHTIHMANLMNIGSKLAVTVLSFFSFKMAAVTSSIMLMSLNSNAHNKTYRRPFVESLIEIGPVILAF